jgi:hypothetical protein
MNGILTPFNVGTGVGSGLSGRILPAGWVVPDGTHVFCLGYDAPGRIERMKAGDSVVISQANPVPAGITLLKVRAYLRSPTAALPGTVNWILSLLIGSTELARRKLSAGRKRELFDLGACVRAYAATTVTVKLALTLEGTGGPYDVELPGVYVDKVDFL